MLNPVFALWKSQMKRRTSILAIAVGLILISSLAYAAKKKEQAKAVAPATDTTSEEEALKAELLNSSEDQRKALRNIDETDPRKIIPIPVYKKINDQITARQPKK